MVTCHCVNMCCIDYLSGPISFSIKPKEIQKPKIEYRTNVIYKQSVEPGESEDEEFGDHEVTEENVNENETESKEEDGKEGSDKEEISEVDVEEQMQSIKAAEKEGNCG